MTIRQMRQLAASRGFLSVRSLAERIGCSRQSIYFALERPSRFPRVFKRLTELLYD